MNNKNMSPWVAAGVASPKKTLTRKEIMDIVCNVMGGDSDEIRKGSRVRELVFPRQMYCYLSRKYTSNTWAEIGQYLNGKDHATAHHGDKTIKENMEGDRRLRDLVRKCELKVEGTISQFVSI